MNKTQIISLMVVLMMYCFQSESKQVPVAYWKLNENIGTAVLDEMSSSFDGNISGATRVAGKYGTALSFDGDDSVSMGNVLDLGTGDRTISLWFKTTSSGPLISKGWSLTSNQHVIYVDPSGVLCALIDISGTDRLVAGYSMVNDDKWHYVALSIDRDDKMRLYVDGVLEDDLDISSDVGVDAANVYNFYLGHSNAYGHYYTGLIDEVKIFSEVLSSQEIQNDYTSSYAYSPIAYWKLNENTGTVIYDEMEVSVDGIIAGAIWAGGVSGSALAFDGNDYVSMGDCLDIGTANRTISLWFKTTNSGPLVSKGWSDTSNQHVIYVDNNGLLNALLDVSGIDYKVTGYWTVNDGKWHHTALTIDRDGVMKLYLDGVIQDSVDVSADAAVNANNIYNFYLAFSNAYDNFYTGSIDNVKIINGVWNEYEVFDDFSCVLNCRLDEGYGTNTYDVSINNKTGTLLGAKWELGKSGNALSFDGDDSVTLGDILDLGTSDRTICLWFKTTESGPLISKGWSLTSNQHVIYVDQSGVLCALIDISGTDHLLAGYSIVNDNEWHSVALTIDRDDKMKLYVDGVLEDDIDISDDAAVNAQNVYNFYLGHSNAYGHYYTGLIDEVKVYNCVLSECQLLKVQGKVPTPEWQDGIPSALRNIRVSNDEQLYNALLWAQPGDHIILADGEYNSKLYAINHGTENNHIVIRAEHLLQATVTAGPESFGAYTTFWGINFEPESADWMKIAADYNKIIRCSFNNMSVMVTKGLETEIGYCEFANIQSLGLIFKTYWYGPVTGSHVYRNYFHDFIGIVGNGHEAISIGLGADDAWVDAQCLVEYNLFDNINLEEEIIAVKSSSNIIQFNTFLNSPIGYLNLRHGNDNEFLANWFENCGGIGVHGYNTRIIGNVGNGTISLFAGDSSPLVTPFGSYMPAAWSNLLAGNEFNVIVGREYTSVTFDVKAKDNCIEANTGTVNIINAKSENTVLEATTTELIPVAFKLTTSQVGPNGHP